MKGRVFGGMLLISGSCIGAGMLGLPIITGFAGFYPTLLMFFAVWMFMTATGLLLVEVYGYFNKPVNLLTMVGHSLGRVGRVLAWIFYLFLFYALLVAYMVLSGNHFAHFFQNVLGINLTDWMGSATFTVIFGGLIYMGTRAVDWLNRGLMLLKIIAFLGLIFLGMWHVSSQNLSFSRPSYTVMALPFLVTSFGFHNMIPSLSTYLKGDIKKIKKSLIGGSFLTLGIYLIWEVLALGIVPHGEIVSSFNADQDAAQAIQNALQQPIVGTFAGLLAFFAILTSFLAQGLSLAHFLGDGLRGKTKQDLQSAENFWYCGLALLPPLGLSILFPKIFFAAINFAGGVCAVVLFGILPALMVWLGRKKQSGSYQVWGGKSLLIMILLVAVFILFYQISNMLGWNLFPTPND